MAIIVGHHENASSILRKQKTTRKTSSIEGDVSTNQTLGQTLERGRSGVREEYGGEGERSGEGYGGGVGEGGGTHGNTKEGPNSRRCLLHLIEKKRAQ